MQLASCNLARVLRQSGRAVVPVNTRPAGQSSVEDAGFADIADIFELAAQMVAD